VYLLGFVRYINMQRTQRWPNIEISQATQPRLPATSKILASLLSQVFDTWDDTNTAPAYIAEMRSTDRQPSPPAPPLRHP